MASAWYPRAWLTERGFDPDGDLRASVPPLSKSTPLHQAAHAGELGVCEWLYAHGAAATVRPATNNRGDSPLMAACAQGEFTTKGATILGKFIRNRWWLVVARSQLFGAAEHRS